MFVNASEPSPGGSGNEALAALKDGNARFAAKKPEHVNTGMDRVVATAAGQNPVATILTCSDSRLPVERIFDQQTLEESNMTRVS